jgi:hypothetical protein
VGKAFEVPVGAARSYLARSPWAEDSKKVAIRLDAGKPWRVALKPFEVLTLDAEPVSSTQ